VAVGARTGAMWRPLKLLTVKLMLMLLFLLLLLLLLVSHSDSLGCVGSRISGSILGTWT
jgi:hypothetical protein